MKKAAYIVKKYSDILEDVCDLCRRPDQCSDPDECMVIFCNRCKVAKRIMRLCQNELSRLSLLETDSLSDEGEDA